MAIERVFFDWSRPALPTTAEYLVGRFRSSESSRELDLQQVVVAVPGGRAGRRLLELLVERAAREHLALSPPRIVTVGKLPELLYEAKRPFADELVQQLAWREALRRIPTEQLSHLMATPPPDDDLAGWLALGEMLGRLHRELAADAHDFRAVVNQGKGIEQFSEESRWETLADVQKRYLEVLDEQELWDLQTARRYAIQEGECEATSPIVLVGTTDLNQQQRMMLDQVADQVTALIFAPEERAQYFDEYGCLIPRLWQETTVDLPTQRIEVVDGPAEQAEAVVRALGAFDGQYSAEQIVLGVPDQRIVPYIEQHLGQCNIGSRYGVGDPVAQTSVYRFLSVVADLLESDTFSAWAAFLRHPDVERWLRRQGIAGDWLSAMDRHQGTHLPHGFMSFSNAEGSSYGDEDTALIQAVHRAVGTLLDSFRDDVSSLDHWGQPIVDLIVAVFGANTLDQTLDTDRRVLLTCEKLLDVLRRQVTVPKSLMPTVTAARAIRLLLKQLGRETISAPRDNVAIEMVGWLELALDDSEAMIITGFNEGIVPGSLNADLFLPNQLRRALGIEDNDRRYARDVHALSVLAASRTELWIVAGRRSSDADPLTPSRLLFACDCETMARRAATFFSSQRPQVSAMALPGSLRPGRETSDFHVPRPKPLKEPVTTMRVTEFRDYLACPYRYYLRHRLRLAVLADGAEELDGGAFGSLAHEVLGVFGQSRLADSTTPEHIEQFLGETIDHFVRKMYGKRPLPSIRVQVEQLRRRLAAFAVWQADWARQGWRIEHVEVAPSGCNSMLDVDGHPMILRGRIDRIDVHRTSGERIVFDYKTSDNAKSPEKAHRKSSGEWTDLQLPLYRHLLHGLDTTSSTRMGYIALPKDVTKVNHLLAEWTETDLAEADREAKAVVRAIRAERFWPPAVPPPSFSEEFAAICQDGQFSAALAGDGEEGV